MLSNRSPPKYKQLATGGSANDSSLSLTSAASTPLLSASSSTTSNSNSNSNVSLQRPYQQHSHACYHHQQQHQHQHHHHSRTSLTPTMKRGKKHWGTRERSGMSFLIVIAFFAVFGLIILTEVFMIDERSHGGMLAMRAGGNGIGGGIGSLSGRMGDSMPDYDNVKEDYDLLDDSLLSDNKLGFIQFRDNKLKIQEAAGADGQRYAGTLLGGGGGGGGAGLSLPLIPWGQLLPGKLEETLPHFPFGTPPSDGAWQIVNGTRFKFFVYSAYFDRRDGARLVRVVGATKTRGPERVWCRFWYGPPSANRAGNGSEPSSSMHHATTRAKYTSTTVMARVKIIRENWNLKYSACFVLCPVRGPGIAVPQYVSIVSRLRAPPGNLLKLRNTDEDADFSSTAGVAAAPPSGENIPDRIAVCVKPFHFNYDQALYLMEYLEFYALLGVSHFTFYNHTLGPHASCVLQNYMRGDVPANLTAYDFEQLPASEVAKNATPRMLRSLHYVRPTVTILPWNLRMRSQKEIRTEGLFAALNDCLYRTMYRYKYLALVDLDEFIVPRYTDTLNELLGSLNLRFRNRNTGAYSFQNAFYYLQFMDDPLATSGIKQGNEQLARVRGSLVTQRKTRRRYKLHPQKQRSKYICKPEAVVEAGNHFVWEFAPGKGSLNVPPKEAILQHYRVCEFGGNDCIKAPSIVDRTTTKYVNRLVQRVDLVYRHLQQRCDLPALPSLPKRPAEVPTQPPQQQQLPKQPVEKPKFIQQMRALNEELDKKRKQAQASKTAGSDTTAAGTTATTTTKMTPKGSVKIKRNVNDEGLRTTRETRTSKDTAKDQAAKKNITPTTAIPSPPLAAPAAAREESKVRRRRKMIVFELNDDSLPVARVLIVDYKNQRKS